MSDSKIQQISTEALSLPTRVPGGRARHPEYFVALDLNEDVAESSARAEPAWEVFTLEGQEVPGQGRNPCRVYDQSQDHHGGRGVGTVIGGLEAARLIYVADIHPAQDKR